MTPQEIIVKANAALAELEHRDPAKLPTIEEIRATFLPKLSTMEKIRARLLSRRGG